MSPPEASRPPRGLISRLHAPGVIVIAFPPPPPVLPPPPLSPVSIAARETAGAPQRSRVAIDAEKLQERVHLPPRRRLRRCAEGIEPRSSRTAASFIVFNSGRRETSLKSGQLQASPSQPPPQFDSG